MQSLSIFGVMEGICFVFQSLEVFEIHLKNFKPTRAHLSAARLPFNRATQLSGPTPARHRAGHQAVTALMAERAPAPVTAGCHRPHAMAALSSRAWAHGRALHLFACSSHPLIGATTDYRSPSTFVPRVCTTVAFSSARVHLQLKAPAKEAGRPTSPCHCLPPAATPSTAILHDSPVEPRVPRAPHESVVRL
jgi:hypothetical protein